MSGVYALLVAVLSAVLGLSNAADASGLPALARGYEEGVRAVNLHVLDKVARRAIPAEAAEGWYLMARLRGVPELNEVVVKLRGSLDLGDDLAKEAGDRAFERVGRSLLRTVDDDLGNPAAVRAARDAVANITRQTDNHLRHLVNSQIGPGRAFATMEEFEALRVLPVERLDSAQRAALVESRLSIIPVSVGTPVRKVMSLQEGIARLSGGDARFSGFFARQMDMDGAVNARQVADRLRLDYDGSPFHDNLPYVELDTIANADIAAKAGVPLHPSAVPFPRPNGVIDHVADPPYTGCGYTASIDGHLTGENLIPRTTPATLSPDVSVMRFKNPDGSPRVVSMGEYGASDRWVMRMNVPNDPLQGFRWEPLP